MRTLFLALLLPAFFALAACQAPAPGTPNQANRVKLAQTEIAATAAYKEVTTLVNAGVIRKGSSTAIIIADAELALAAAIRVWRTNPDDPQFASAGIAALPSLLQIIASVKAGKMAVLIYVPSHHMWRV